MAIHMLNTPSGVNEPALPRGLLRGFADAAPCSPPHLTAETVALLDEQPARHDFSPAAIMARANACATEQAERAARLQFLDDPRSAEEVLEEIRREIEKPELPPEPLIAAATALHARRALEQALDHGTALLAALGLPPLRAMTRAMSLLDAIDAPGEDLEQTGDAEPWLAWVSSPSTGCVDTGIFADDREGDTADLEPSLGSPEMHSVVISYVGGRWHGVEPDQRHWADGSTSDREAEITDEPHDDQEDEEEPDLEEGADAEPSLARPEGCQHETGSDRDLEEDNDFEQTYEDPFWLPGDPLPVEATHA